MSDFQNLHFEKKDKIAYITIDRPKVLNALSTAVMDEMRRAFATAKDDAEVRVVILTGAGEKAFVAGADIIAAATGLPSQRHRLHGVRSRRRTMKGHPQLAAQRMHFLLQGLVVDAAAIQFGAQLADIVLAGTQFAFDAIAAVTPTRRDQERQAEAASH